MAVTPTLPLEIGDKRYTLEFPLAAVVKAEEKIGRSLKAASDWFCAPAKDIPALLEAGLSRHHPDITPEEISSICECINPESYAEFAEALGALAFPRFTARYRENLEKLRAKGTEPGKAESVAAP
jgi:hypothetical protein